MEIEAAADVKERVAELLDAYFRLSGGEDIEISGGEASQEGAPMAAYIVVRLGKQEFPFAVPDARELVRCAELAFVAHPAMREDQGLATFLAAIKLASDTAAEMFGKTIQ